MSYIGVPPFGQTVRTITEKIASASQTTFQPSGGYVAGYIDVVINGVQLLTTDFTASDGINVVLGVACASGDEFQSIAYWPVSIIDTVNSSVARGGGNDKIFFENDQVVTSNYTITAGKNAMSAGNITINDGVVVTTPDGSVWTIV